MANTTSATVTGISGRAWVRQPDGSLTELHPGAVIPPQSEVLTASGSSVTLAIDGAAPITLGENRSVALTDELAAPADPSAAAIADMSDSARLLAALESGDDPFGILEATAAIAGEAGGEDGGGSFVRLLRILEPTSPLDLAYPRPVRPEQELPRHSDVALNDDGGGALGGGGGTSPNDNIKGGQGNDVILGGSMRSIVAGHDYNVALVLDLSESMNDKWGTGGKTRLATAKEALKTFLENTLATHDGNINVSLITFSDGAAREFSFEKLSASHLPSIRDQIDKLSAPSSPDINTNYLFAFTETKQWFDDMEVTDPNGAYFRFDAVRSQWTNAIDVFTWELLKWDADTNSWGVVDFGDMTRDNEGTVVTTSHQGPGVYRFRFSVNDHSGSNGEARVDIDNIHIHATDPSAHVGESQIVTVPTDLTAALTGSSTTTVGDDVLYGGDGNDILFGDAINADKLPWGIGNNPVKPGGFDEVGLNALKAFLTLHPDFGNGAKPPTDADLHAYITQHHALFNDNSDTHGGKDTLHGGAGKDILYGQGGNDELYGEDGDDVLYGGAGDDLLDGGDGDDLLIGGQGDDILIGGQGDDTFRWLAGDEGTVGSPAQDMIKDFGNGNNVLDLRDLLHDEENSTDLSLYLHITRSGTDTVIEISTNGDLSSGPDQIITLENVDLVGSHTDSHTDQNALINELIASGKLQIDT